MCQDGTERSPKTGSVVVDQAAAAIFPLTMPLCSSSSSTGFGPLGRRPLQRKVVVIGDGGCGKVSHLHALNFLGLS